MDVPPTAAETDVHEPGDQLGNYKITAKLGQGGMSAVYRARDVILGRDVALKILPAQLVTTRPQRFEQFLREAKSAARLQHPNVVTIYHIDQQDGDWYVAMELVEGRSLKDIVEQGRPLAVNYCLNILVTVARALGKAHERGILHRDIKPSNIMVGKVGVIKVTDFGLATEWDVEVRRGQSQRAVGTPLYMAPELCYGHPPTPATDMYALGMTFYVMLTNDKPYAAGDVIETFKNHVNAPIPNLLYRRPDCPPALQRVLNKLLAKKPTERYEWMDQLLEDLTRLEEITESGPLPSELALYGTMDAANLALSESRVTLPTVGDSSVHEGSQSGPLFNSDSDPTLRPWGAPAAGPPVLPRQPGSASAEYIQTPPAPPAAPFVPPPPGSGDVLTPVAPPPAPALPIPAVAQGSSPGRAPREPSRPPSAPGSRVGQGRPRAAPPARPSPSRLRWIIAAWLVGLVLLAGIAVVVAVQLAESAAPKPAAPPAEYVAPPPGERSRLFD